MAIRKERLSSLVVILFGAGFLLYNVKYPLDTWGNPGPGIFPLMAGIALVILAAWELARDVLKPASTRNEKSNVQGASLTETFRATHGERKIMLMIAIFVLYILMIKWIGFFVSNFFFVIIASRLIGARSWSAPVALSAGINLFCYALFDLWLKLSFPRGVLF
jgi:putative tricarboxylic transport membrane protein